MIKGSDKLKEFPEEFNVLEERVKSLEKKVAELEQAKQKVEEMIGK